MEGVVRESVGMIMEDVIGKSVEREGVRKMDGAG